VCYKKLRLEFVPVFGAKGIIMKAKGGHLNRRMPGFIPNWERK